MVGWDREVGLRRRGKKRLQMSIAIGGILGLGMTIVISALQGMLSLDHVGFILFFALLISTVMTAALLLASTRR